MTTENMTTVAEFRQDENSLLNDTAVVSIDYRDLVITDLANMLVATEAERDDAIVERDEARAALQIQLEIRSVALSMLARVTYERDLKERRLREMFDVNAYDDARNEADE